MNFIKTFFQKIVKKPNKGKDSIRSINENITNDKIEKDKETKFKSYNYSDASLTKEEKIQLEKRRRYQAYMTLDYLLSVVTYFDFFSQDAFRIAKKAKDLSQILNKKKVTSELLLLPFFENNLEVCKLLEKYGINQKSLTQTICPSTIKYKKKVEVKETSRLKKFLIRLNIPWISNRVIVPASVEYSYEVNQIFEKAAENALKRFKTPVISSEILLITILETKKSKAAKLLQTYLKNETNWFMLRYALMKRLHKQELTIRNEVPKNQQYFSYLLKTQLSEFEFDTLMEKEYVSTGVSMFRNLLISEVMKTNLLETVKNDIYISMKISGKRNYSS